MTEKIITPESQKQEPPLVLECIDFRTNAGNREWLAQKGFAEGSYHVYASAGASANPVEFIQTVAQRKPSIIKVLDHEDCGFYKANGLYTNGNTPYQAHHHNLENLGIALHQKNREINYRYNLLPLNKKERQRHTCTATVIALGEPDIVKFSRQLMAKLNLANDYDKIARPYSLSPSDETIWNDLEISLKLHNPQQLYIFDKNRENVHDLAKIAREIAPNLMIVPYIVSGYPVPR